MFRRYIFPFLLLWGLSAGLAAMLPPSKLARLLPTLIPVAVGLVVVITISVLLAVLVHEVGHVLGGLLAGFQFQAMQVGPVELRKSRGRLKVATVPGATFSGFARMVPSFEDRLVARTLLYIVGGPLASLVYVVVAYALFRQTGVPQKGDLLRAVPYLFSLSLFFMGLSVLPGTLIPFVSGNGTPTDMKVLLTLLGPAAVRDRLVAILLLNREILGGVRARDWGDPMIGRLTLLSDGRIEELRGRILAYYHYADRGDLAEARTHLARAVDLGEIWGRKAGILKEIAVLESAFQAAWADHRVEAAMDFRARVTEVSVPAQSTALLADAAIAIRRGEGERAAELLSQAERAVYDQQARFGGSVAQDLERIDELRRSLQVTG